MEENKNTNIIKYLKLLMYLHIASLILGLIDFLPLVHSLSVWVNRGISVGVIYCLYSLSPVAERYRKSAIFHAIVLIAGLVANPMIALAGSVCSILASWQEYHGHSELVEPYHQRLSKQWGKLFALELMAGIFMALITTLMTVVLTMTNGNQAVDISSTALMGIIMSVGYIVEVLYIFYMKHTVELLEA